MDEFREIYETLPRSNADYGDIKNMSHNAKVVVDPHGRINIFPESGGWIGISSNGLVVEADIAPWAD